MSVSSEQMPWCIKVNEYTFQGTFDSWLFLEGFYHPGKQT